MKDILYDLTELLTAAFLKEDIHVSLDLTIVKYAHKLGYNLNDYGKDNIHELIGEIICDMVGEIPDKLYEFIKDIDVGYDTTEAKSYLLNVCKRMEVC